MKLMVFEKAGGIALGVVQGNEVVDLSAVDPALPRDVGALAAGGETMLARVKEAAASAPATARHQIAELKPALPVTRPGKFICVGLNYAAHAAEGGHEIPTYPALFVRTQTSLIPAGAPIVRPRVSEKLDYECELTIVIGKRCRHVSEADSLDKVFGYTIFNDASVRDYQRKSAQWTAGKNFDGTGPFGPVVVTADELPPGASGLRIQTRLNGQTVQDSNTSDMIFSTAKLVATLSEFMTLEPGDVIATGTPSGVAHARKPPLWMKDGDVCEIEIEKIGVLRNPVVQEA
ncbi:MAG: fumarylacetoacetate hydrolase family protein [Hyphomicrobiaceae bacterium]